MKTFVKQLTNEGVTLTAYLLDISPEMGHRKKNPAVLICPGGAYKYCSDREAEPIAMAFLAEGYNAFILRYSINENAAFPKPLNDAEEALTMIRINSEEWDTIDDKIAVCGFSAGGHLAAALATMGKIRPDAAILGYACILESMGKILAAPIPSLEKEVDSKTPPTFLFATADDNCVPVENSLKFAQALDENKIPFEMHIFQSGPHGIALANSITASKGSRGDDKDIAKWVNLCTCWLKKVFEEEKSK